MSLPSLIRVQGLVIASLLAITGLSAAQTRETSLDTTKQQIDTLLRQREFARAYDAAVALNKEVPDDVLVYGYVADASIALGKYKEAEDAVQWMLDLRSTNLFSLQRTAALRELFGDVDSAIDLLGQVFVRIPPTDVAERARLLSEIGRLYHAIGREPEADAALQQALTLVPRHPAAVRALAQVRLAQSRAADAVALLHPLVADAPEGPDGVDGPNGPDRAEDVYALADALHRAGRRAEATRTFARFEKLALASSSNAANANRALILYYVDRAGRPRDALRIAQLEFARRQDVYTRDAYAWALAANGRRAEARQQIDAALAIGTRDPRILEHARTIRR
jgi:tetratricopeptide (TPR) repeat protein